MKAVQAYKCDFCHRCFGRKVDAHNHEVRCNGNPCRRHCKTCVHGILAICGYAEQPEFIFGEQREPTTPFYGPWCDHFDEGMDEKPYFNECDETSAYDEIRPSPGTCQHYEYKGHVGFIKPQGDV